MDKQDCMDKQYCVDTQEAQAAAVTHVHSQHALAAEDVLGFLSQQIPHEHVEAVLVQGPARNNAHTANAAEIVHLLAPALGTTLTLHGEKGK
jgi:hypothetical protein